MEVKGHQRSNVVTYVLFYHTWSEEFLMQGHGDNDLKEGQRSSEVEYCKLCAIVETGSEEPMNPCKFDNNDFNNDLKL